MKTIKVIYYNLTQPYRKSKHRSIYEQIAKEHKTDPQRVYNLAHGIIPQELYDYNIVRKLVHYGIMH